MSPFVEPLDVAVASQETVTGLEFTPQQGQEVIGKMAPPVVDLTHDNVSAPELDVRTGFAAPVRVQDQQANFEEEAVWGDVKAAHFVESIAAHHQGDESYPFTQHIDVMDNPIDSKFTVAVILSLLLLLPALAHAEGVVCEVRLSLQDVKLVKEAGGTPVEEDRRATVVPVQSTDS